VTAAPGRKRGWMRCNRIAPCRCVGTGIPGATGGQWFQWFPHLMERAKPGFIAVRQDGRRFVNEGRLLPRLYVRAVQRLRCARSPGVLADLRSPRPASLWAGLVQTLSVSDSALCTRRLPVQSPDPSELARQCGIDAQQLEATVNAFNQGAEQGRDLLFQRGASLYNKAQGKHCTSRTRPWAACAKGLSMP
jgi:hypothetical protein